MGCLKLDKCPFYKDSKTNHTIEVASEASHEGRGDFLLPATVKAFHYPYSTTLFLQHSKRAQLTITISR